jgi:hypothetical protein
MKHNIIIAATVQSYCNSAVEAETEQEAERLVQDSIDKEGFDSPFYRNAEDWDTDWLNAENLRIL